MLGGGGGCEAVDTHIKLNGGVHNTDSSENFPYRLLLKELASLLCALEKISLPMDFFTPLFLNCLRFLFAQTLKLELHRIVSYILLLLRLSTER